VEQIDRKDKVGASHPITPTMKPLENFQ